LATGVSSREDIVRLAELGQALASPTEAYFEIANRWNSKCRTSYGEWHGEGMRKPTGRLRFSAR
jgi:hypothetical protein